MRRRHLSLLVTLPTLPALSACGISLRQPTSSSGAAVEREAPRIDVRAAFEAVSAGRAVLVDVRGESAFRTKRAAGAILVPLEELERSPAAAQRIPSGKQPIFYCTWPSEHTSARAALIVLDAGRKDSVALRGGLDAWEAAGYPMESA